MRTSGRFSVASMLLFGVLACLALAGCGGSDEPDRTPTSTGAPSPTAGTPPPTTVATGAAFSALPACNVLPAQLRGTFKADMLKIDQEPKAGDKWTTGSSCLGLLAGRTVALTVALRLFPADTDASGYARSEAGDADTATGWGDEAWWSQPDCSLVTRYRNIVATFAQRAPGEGCRAEVERLAKGFAGQHFTG